MEDAVQNIVDLKDDVISEVSTSRDLQIGMRIVEALRILRSVYKLICNVHAMDPLFTAICSLIKRVAPLRNEVTDCARHWQFARQIHITHATSLINAIDNLTVELVRSS